MAKTSTTATLKQVLLWYDEPQIVLLSINPFQYVVGVAAEIDGYVTPFVGASVSIRQLLDYKLERIDLRYLYLHADGRKWWTFDLDDDPEAIKLKKVSGKAEIVDNNAPETGFFSRFHDEITSLSVDLADSKQTFEIDGTWDLGEFSQFYGQVEDIYYFFHSMAEYKKSGTSAMRKAQIHDALVRPFRGGGSYVGLYNDFANDNNRAARLRVSGIQYHSPGYVEVRALEEPFNASIALLAAYAEKKSTIKSLYKDLYKTLSKNNLLKKDANTVYSKELSNLIVEQSLELSNALYGVSFLDILEVADENLLIAAKVLLSVDRRVDRLFQFFDEGRAKHSDVTIN